jgi:putative heme iron utilization protein
MPDDALAAQVAEALQADPTLTVQDLAADLDASEADIVMTLDEYDANGGSPIHKGPGEGGGWIPEE